jgi:hypothetical protein
MIRENIKEFKTSVKGKFFKAVFIKNDGTLREMICRFGVKSHLKGGELGYSPEAHNNLIVFDVQKMAYRTINLDKLIALKCGKREIVGNHALMHVLS